MLLFSLCETPSNCLLKNYFQNFQSHVYHCRVRPFFRIVKTESTYRELNLLLIISIYLIFFSLEMQRELLQTKVYYKLLDSSEQKRITNLQKQQQQKALSSVCMLCIHLALINIFIPCKNWKTFLVFSTATLLLSLEKVLRKKSVIYVISTVTDSANTEVSDDITKVMSSILQYLGRELGRFQHPSSLTNFQIQENFETIYQL